MNLRALLRFFLAPAVRPRQTVRGFGAQVAPFLRIAAERYYFWQRFFQIPLFLLTNVAFAGTARLLAAACGRRRGSSGRSPSSGRVWPSRNGSAGGPPRPSPSSPSCRPGR